MKAAKSKNIDQYQFDKIGTKSRASVFYGFCNRHDASLFDLLDNQLFDSDLAYCNQLALRSLAHEAYHHQRNLNINRDVLEHLQQTSTNAEVLANATRRLSPSFIGETRFGVILNLLKLMLLPEQSLPIMSVKHLVVEIDESCPIQSCGAMLARYTTIGRELSEFLRKGDVVDRAFSALTPPIEVISTCRSEFGICIVISLFSHHSSNWQHRWISDFEEIDANKRLKFLFAHLIYASGTTYIRPEWFNSESDSSKRTMLSFANSGKNSSGYFSKITPRVLRSVERLPYQMQVISN
jgi:hypothetical protein